MLAALIQARMGATRLPGKTLREICGKPLLEHLIERVEASKFVEDVIIATTPTPRDDVLVEFARQRGLKWYRGSEEDVLDRFYRAAVRFGIQAVVRVTPDCPLTDPRLIDRAIEIYRSGRYDYVSNASPRTYPDGLDVEVFSFEALGRAWREAQFPSEREHVTPYFRTSGRFRIFNIEYPTNLSHLKWSIDTAEDLDFVRAVFVRLYDSRKLFSMEDVLELLEKFPELRAINAGSVVNEGYYRSLVKDAPPPARPRELRRSQALKRKGEALVPGCSQTVSKGPSQFVQGVAPVFLIRGEGSWVWDIDGNEYVDYSMALGAIILGHTYPAVTEAVRQQLSDGTIFSLPHPLEVEVAELLVEIFPCAEMVRFGKNGSDATAGAVRLARAYTGREVVACCGYHGWQDWYIGISTRNKGVPQAVRNLTIPFEYNNIESLIEIFASHPGQVAAVIMEPVGVVEPHSGFLEEVRNLTWREGVVLIFDEILTGFRLARGGAQEHYGVVPDLACIGKAMANGYPISAVVGRRELMALFDEVFFSFTFGGEALSLAAARATIAEMANGNVIGHLWAQGRRLKDGYNTLAREFRLERFTRCVGLPPRTVFTFQDEVGAESFVLGSLFQQECIKRRVLLSGGQNICYSHGNAEIEHTFRAYRDALEILSKAIDSGNPRRWLEGEPVQPVFRPM